MQRNQLGFVLSVLAVLLLSSCQNRSAEDKTTKTIAPEEKSGEFVLAGKIRGADSGYVYFSRIDTVKGNRIQLDSAKVTNGNFEFKGVTSHPKLYHIGFKHRYKAGNVYKQSGIIFNKVIFIEAGKINITGQRDSMLYVVTRGSKAQAAYDEFEQNKKSLNDKINYTYGEKLAASKKGKKVLDSVTAVLNGYYGQLQDVAISNIRKYPDVYSSAYIAVNYLNKAEVRTLKPLYESLSAHVQASYFGKELLKMFQASERTAIGSMVPDFSIPDVNGKNSGPSAFRGKYVLVDFWASWCGPCRTEHPNLRKVYSSFQQKGFEILSVSMDDNRERWLMAVKEDKLPWMQLSDLKGSKSPLKELYGIQSIPTNFLLDKEGKIIARNLMGGDLAKKLEEVLRK